MIDIDYIESLIQTILDNAFTHPSKRKILKSSKELRFACPICGDSAKNMAEKRGHLYFNTLKYKCYNEGCSKTLTSLCKDNKVSIDTEKKNQFIKYIDEHTIINVNNSDDFILSSLDKLFTIQQLETYFNTSEDSIIRGFSKVRKGSKIYNYLLNRKIPYQSIELLYEGLYKITDTWWEPVVVIINMKGDKVLGLQVRNTKSEKNRRIFKIHNFHDLYNKIYPENDLDEIEAAAYNKISALFNFFNVNFENKITIFEGYFDSTFYPNSIGTVGTNTDLSILFNDDINKQFFFDNDIAGKLKSLELLKQGHSVFLWDKLIHDQAKIINTDYHIAYEILSKIKDLNELALNIDNPYKQLNLKEYFSKDLFDKKWIKIPVTQKKNKNDKDIIPTLDSLSFKLNQLEFII